MRAGLELWARRVGVRLDVVDDESKPERAVRIHEELAARGCRFVLGPYGSDSTREVAEARAGSVVWNHGAAADEVQRLPGVVSVATPASRYLVALGRAWPSSGRERQPRSSQRRGDWPASLERGSSGRPACSESNSFPSLPRQRQYCSAGR
jgi:hypothetical protein